MNPRQQWRLGTIVAAGIFPVLYAMIWFGANHLADRREAKVSRPSPVRQVSVEAGQLAASDE